QFAPLKTIHLASNAPANWNDGGISIFGVPGFNETKFKPGAEQIMTVNGRPLLVVGQYGSGRTVAFTGFTPGYHEERAYWDTNTTFPYLVDQQLYQEPATRLTFICLWSF